MRKEGQLPGHSPFLGDGETMLVEDAQGNLTMYAGRKNGAPARVGRGAPVVSADLVGAAQRVANTTYQAQETTLVIVEVETLRSVAPNSDADTAAYGKIGPADPPATTVATAYLYLLVGAGDQGVDIDVIQTMTFVVPAGSFYRVETLAGSTILRWIEVTL